MTFPGKILFFQANIKLKNFSSQELNSMTFQGLYEPCLVVSAHIKYAFHKGFMTLNQISKRPLLLLFGKTII